jgi:DNA-binding CsgD family transcriptional regulator
MHLRRADLEAILGFLVDVGGLEFDELYPIDVVARLGDLVPCEAITYQEIDLRTSCFPVSVSWTAERLADLRGETDADHEAEQDALYWTVGPCPITVYRARTGDLSPVRMSDVIGGRRYHEQPIFREYFHPGGLDYVIDIGLPAPPERYRSFILFRRTEDGDFSERDRAVLELLRPHLHELEARAALRRRLREVPETLDANGRSAAWDGLTLREREILSLVAGGGTNAQIASRLWVAPSTVKKHLEHVYEKLGVGGRTAAAMFVHTRDAVAPGERTPPVPLPRPGASPATGYRGTDVTRLSL